MPSTFKFAKLTFNLFLCWSCSLSLQIHNKWTRDLIYISLKIIIWLLLLFHWEKSFFRRIINYLCKVVLFLSPAITYIKFIITFALNIKFSITISKTTNLTSSRGITYFCSIIEGYFEYTFICPSCTVHMNLSLRLKLT